MTVVASHDLGIMANNQQLVEWLYKATRSGASAYQSVPPHGTTDSQAPLLGGATQGRQDND